VIGASVALVIAAAVVLAIGESEPEVGPPIPIPVDRPPDAVRPMPERPHAVPPEAFVPGPEGYEIADVVLGAGDVPVAVDRTPVFDFVVWYDDARAVGTSYSRPAPTRVHLSADATGWITALVGVTAGGVRQVRSTEESGAKTVIEVIVHEVLVPPGPVDVPSEQRVHLPSGIEIADLTVGPGIAAEVGQQATFEYAVFAADGTELDSSWRRASPVRVQLGHDRLVFEPVVLGMTVATRRQAWVPPSVAFPQGPPQGIDPDSYLLLLVELTAVTI